jgi:acyl-coenzyme A thioesterase 13
MGAVKIVDASIGPPYESLPNQPVPPAAIVSSVTFALDIDPSMCNLNGVMHGGAAGVIFDMCTTMALGPIARPGSWE